MSNFLVPREEFDYLHRPRDISRQYSAIEHLHQIFSLVNDGLGHVGGLHKRSCRTTYPPNLSR